jgi:hypothetical protein
MSSSSIIAFIDGHDHKGGPVTPASQSGESKAPLRKTGGAWLQVAVGSAHGSAASALATEVWPPLPP